VVAGDGFVEEPFLAIDVDRPLLAVRADEIGHEVRLVDAAISSFVSGGSQTKQA
jgi:hypothetical protein